MVDPAFTLAAACCRWPDDAGTDAAVRAAASEVDWPSFLTRLRRDRIEGLAAAALARAGVAPPPEGARHLAERAQAIARQGLLRAAESARLQCSLDAAGLTNLVLKGATLDILAWGRLGLKDAWDIDLLVEPAAVDAALGVLIAEGYRLVHPPDGPERSEAWRRWVALSKECALIHQGSGQVVELHWRLVDAAGLLTGLSASSPCQSVSLSPTLTLRTLSAEALFAYLCVHGTSHAWWRLKWLADLGALVAPLEDAALLDLHAKAADLGAGRCATVALALVARVLARPMPPRLSRAASRDPRSRVLLALSGAALGGPPERELEDRLLLGDAVLLSPVLFGDGPAFVFAELARRWTSLDDRRRMILPAPLGFLYHLVRAPLWLWRRVRRLAAGSSLRPAPLRPILPRERRRGSL